MSCPACSSTKLEYLWSWEALGCRLPDAEALSEGRGRTADREELGEELLTYQLTLLH